MVVWWRVDRKGFDARENERGINFRTLAAVRGPRNTYHTTTSRIQRASQGGQWVASVRPNSKKLALSRLLTQETIIC
jgi:hypothetical protein